MRFCIDHLYTSIPYSVDICSCTGRKIYVKVGSLSVPNWDFLGLRSWNQNRTKVGAFVAVTHVDCISRFAPVFIEPSVPLCLPQFISLHLSLSLAPTFRIFFLTLCRSCPGFRGQQDGRSTGETAANSSTIARLCRKGPRCAGLCRFELQVHLWSW